MSDVFDVDDPRTGYPAAKRGADAMLAILDAADPEAVAEMGARLAGDQVGVLSGVGQALTAPGTLRRLFLADAIFDARLDASTDDLAESLAETGDALWTALGASLAEVRSCWKALGGR